MKKQNKTAGGHIQPMTGRLPFLLSSASSHAVLEAPSSSPAAGLHLALNPKLVSALSIMDESIKHNIQMHSVAEMHPANHAHVCSEFPTEGVSGTPAPMLRYRSVQSCTIWANSESFSSRNPRLCCGTTVLINSSGQFLSHLFSALRVPDAGIWSLKDNLCFFWLIVDVLSLCS